MISKLTIKRIAAIAVVCIAAVTLTNCTVSYSFTGASISPDVQTVSIDNFPNSAPLVNPALANSFTEALKDRFTTQTRLALQDYGGDLQFQGEITGYDVAPTAIQGDETAALNRLTVSVHVRYVNLKDKTANFEKSFTAYEEFPSNKQITQVEAELIPLIIEKLVNDIFNAAVANW